MRRADRTRKRTQKITPGGRMVWRFKKARPSHARCGSCGAKLNRPRLTPARLKKLPKSSRRPERPLPGLCPRCMREEIKSRVRA